MGHVLRLFTVDAFSGRPFEGNPAVVCLDDTDSGLSEDVMQKIAMEMNISETAFIRRLPNNDGCFEKGSCFGLRWFTPTTEVPLCGHATLASAAALFHCIGNPSESLQFETLSGALVARRHGCYISLDLPVNPPEPQNSDELEPLLQHVVDMSLIQELQYSPTTKKLLVRMKDTVTRATLESLRPAIGCFAQAHSGKVRGVIVTVRASSSSGGVDHEGRPYDFLSRYFAPWMGIDEDPVTGSAHTVLTPYWAKVLGKTTMYGRQCSARGGDVEVVLRDGGRVDVAGKATVVISGTINI